ncbi:hypothetical protein EL469_12915, partial [Enterococcus faecalis]|nr:hypothetical protein [Enterococcus faecalis]
MLKNLQPQFFKQIVIYGLLFVFWGTLNYFFESIPKGLNRIVFGILSFTYIFLYMKNRKSVSGNKGDLAIWILIISGFFALVDVTYYLNIRGKITLYFSLVYILSIILIFIVCELKSDPKIKLKNILKISAVVYSLGFFDRDWWTVIPLFTAFVLLFYSKEGIDYFAQEELTEIKIPNFLQKKWRRTKFLIVIWSVMLYSSFVISDILESCGWINKISLYFFPEDSLEFYRIWF